MGNKTRFALIGLVILTATIFCRDNLYAAEKSDQARPTPHRLCFP